jgi:hypothetical protein
VILRDFLENEFSQACFVESAHPAFELEEVDGDSWRGEMLVRDRDRSLEESSLSNFRGKGRCARIAEVTNLVKE